MRRWLPFLLLTLLAPGLWAGGNAMGQAAYGYEIRNGSADPAGYVDGMSLYAGYFAPNGLDPYGLFDLEAFIGGIGSTVAEPFRAAADVVTISGALAMGINREDVHLSSGSAQATVARLNEGQGGLEATSKTLGEAAANMGTVGLYTQGKAVYLFETGQITYEQLDQMMSSAAGGSVAAVGIAGAAPLVSPKVVAPLRLAYVDEVNGLAALRDAARGAGLDAKATARLLNQARRDIGEEYKGLTPPKKLEEIYARNIEKYGDKMGPTVDWFRSKGYSWEKIIESSMKDGGKDLDFMIRQNPNVPYPTTGSDNKGCK